MSVIIIGGTFGIGLELAKKYLGKTNNLIILGRSENKFIQIKKDLFNDSTNIICKKVDVTNTNETQNALREIITNYGDLELVVYSSGFYKPNNTFDVDLDLYRKTIEVNFMGLINVMSIILKLLIPWKHCSPKTMAGQLLKIWSRGWWMPVVCGGVRWGVGEWRGEEVGCSERQRLVIILEHPLAMGFDLVPERVFASTLPAQR